MAEITPMADYGGKFRPMQNGDTILPALLPMSETSSSLVSKTGHGFVIGEPVRLDVDSSGTQTWSAAYATADLAHLATHYVVEVVDVDTFRAAASGYWAITPASPVYGLEYLGAIAGHVSSAPPSGKAIQPLGILDAAGLHINITSYVRDLAP